MSDRGIPGIRKVIAREKWDRLRARLRASLSARFFLRLHMTLIIAFAWLSGLLASWALKGGGISDATVRYPAAVTVAYVVFVAAVALWIRTLRRARHDHGADIDPSLGDIGLPGSERTGGGGSGEGGSDAGGSLLDLLVIEEGAVVIAAIGIVLMTVSVAGGLYLIWEAPAFAVEGILEAVLATGALRVRGVVPAGGILRYVLKRTWWIAALATIVAFVVALLFVRAT